jgi:Fur family transcriptional regulator, ferric uptake regulator
VPLPAIPVSQLPEDKFREYLVTRPKPQRYTEQQRDLVRHIFGKHHHFDADILIDDLKASGLKISRATVYRTLAKLVEAGMLRRLEIGNRTFYEHDYGYPQHEHLICEACGKMIEFQHPHVEALLREVCHANDFRAESHTFLVRGICHDCSRSRSSRRKLDLI